MQPSILPPRQQNVIYFYDLPKNDYTSTKLATLIKQKSGVDVQQPQVRRDINKPFYTVVIRIDNPDQFERVKADFRYFEFEKAPCRALPYCQDLLGVNLPKLQEQNLFVRKINKEFKSDDLENEFKRFGGIISCKVSLDEKHKSRGYGFVCFQDAEYAREALAVMQGNDSLVAVKFAPKSRTDGRKAFNNIFVKNLPTDVTDEEIQKLFGPYGNISSLHSGQSKNDSTQKFYFVCFNSPNKEDIEYGPRCAAKAIEQLNGMEYKGSKLYVKEALKKAQREKELEHETLKYKSSKKRCNLYVKGFDNETTEKVLRDIFGQFGEIESCRVFEAKDNKSPYAFVCYKTPDQAQAAKNQQNLMVNNKQLFVNHYEIKQYRDLKNEDNKDKQDFQRHLQENGQGTVDTSNMNQITNIIKQLMNSMRPQGAPGGPNQGFNQGYQNQGRGGNQNYPRDGQQQRQNNYPSGGQRGGYGGQRGGYQNHQAQQPIGQARPPAAIAPPTPGIINPLFAPAAGNVTPSAHHLANKFYGITVPILGAVNEHNPQYKQTVGGAIFEFVQFFVQHYAPKVTGMLIDLPVPEIQKYMVNFDLFQQRVSQATTLLEQQAIVAQQQN